MLSHNKGVVSGRTSVLRAMNYACNSQIIVKIGVELPKLSQKWNWVSAFLDHPVYVIV